MRCFLDRDNDGHWYVVQNDFREDWDAWLQLDDDDEAAWDEPDYAYRLGGSPHTVTFENWRDE